MKLGKNDLHPTFGYAIVEEIDLGKTAAGLVIPSLSVDAKGHTKGAGHHRLLEASRGHIVDGMLVECEMHVGDLVMLAPGSSRASMPHFPQKTYVVRLMDCMSWEREKAS